jgi:hypothetical protein
MICSGLWRLRFMGLLLAKSGRSGSSHKGWISFWGPRQQQRTSTRLYRDPLNTNKGQFFGFVFLNFEAEFNRFLNAHHQFIQ